MNLQPLGILDFVALVTNTRKNHKHKEKSPSKPQTQIHKPTNPQTHNPPQLPNSHATAYCTSLLQIIRPYSHNHYTPHRPAFIIPL